MFKILKSKKNKNHEGQTIISSNDEYEEVSDLFIAPDAKKYHIGQLTDDKWMYDNCEYEYLVEPSNLQDLRDFIPFIKKIYSEPCYRHLDEWKLGTVRIYPDKGVEMEESHWRQGWSNSIDILLLKTKTINKLLKQLSNEAMEGNLKPSEKTTVVTLKGTSYPYAGWGCEYKRRYDRIEVKVEVEKTLAWMFDQESEDFSGSLMSWVFESHFEEKIQNGYGDDVRGNSPDAYHRLVELSKHCKVLEVTGV